MQGPLSCKDTEQDTGGTGGPVTTETLLRRETRSHQRPEDTGRVPPGSHTWFPTGSLQNWKRSSGDDRPYGPRELVRLRSLFVKCRKRSQAQQHPAGRSPAEGCTVSRLPSPAPQQGSLHFQLVFLADETNVIAPSVTLCSLPHGRGQSVSPRVFGAAAFPAPDVGH